MHDNSEQHIKFRFIFPYIIQRSYCVLDHYRTHKSVTLFRRHGALLRQCICCVFYSPSWATKFYHSSDRATTAKIAGEKTPFKNTPFFQHFQGINTWRKGSVAHQFVALLLELQHCFEVNEMQINYTL